MMREEIISLLRLQIVPNIGEVSAWKLIRKCGSADSVFREKKNTLLKVEGIGTRVLRHLHEAQYLRLAEREYRFTRDRGIDVVPFQDKRYPRHLKHCPDAPLLLFTRGNINLSEKRIISIVGTRNMTRQGADFCQKLVEELVPLQPVIVSGFAYGVDICAQTAATEAGLQTIGCLAHGLNQIYPKVHKRYCAQIERKGGFITEFWSSSNPEKMNFLKRNRIIAGMSEATIVIESGERGGSLVTADLANDYNRDVFAVPGRPGDVYSEGTNRLIKTQKAHLLTSAADLVFHLNWDLETPTSPGIQKRLFIEMNSTEEKIYSQLHNSGKLKLDEIAMRSGLPVGKTASTLLAMEMKGVVRPFPGKYFETI